MAIIPAKIEPNIPLEEPTKFHPPAAVGIHLRGKQNSPSTLVSGFLDMLLPPVRFPRSLSLRSLLGLGPQAKVQSVEALLVSTWLLAELLPP